MKKFFSDKKNIWLFILTVLLVILIFVIAFPSRSDIILKDKDSKFTDESRTKFSAQLDFLYFFDEYDYFETLEIKAYNQKKECSASFSKLYSSDLTYNFFYGDRIQIHIYIEECTALNLKIEIYGVNLNDDRSPEFKKLIKSQSFSLSI